MVLSVSRFLFTSIFYCFWLSVCSFCCTLFFPLLRVACPTREISWYLVFYFWYSSTTQSNCGWQGLLDLLVLITVLHEELFVGQGPWVRNWSKGYGRTPLTALLPVTCSAVLLLQSMTTYPGWHFPQLAGSSNSVFCTTTSRTDHCCVPYNSNSFCLLKFLYEHTHPCGQLSL